MGYWIGGIIFAIAAVLFLWGWLSQRRLYGPHGHKRRPDIYVLAMHGKVKKRLSKVGFEGLSEAEKVCWSTVWLWRIVQLGGFENYYSEPYGDYAVEAAKGFEAIGARGYANIVRRANKLFDKGRPGRIRELRAEQLKDMGEDGLAELVELDEEFRQCKDDLDVLLAEYIAAHREEFLRK